MWLSRYTALSQFVEYIVLPRIGKIFAFECRHDPTEQEIKHYNANKAMRDWQRLVNMPRSIVSHRSNDPV